MVPAPPFFEFGRSFGPQTPEAKVILTAINRDIIWDAHNSGGVATLESRNVDTREDHLEAPIYEDSGESLAPWRIASKSLTSASRNFL